MRTYGCRKSDSSVFSTGGQKRRYLLAARKFTYNTNSDTNSNINSNSNSSKAFRTGRKEKLVVTPIRISRFQPRQHKKRRQPLLGGRNFSNPIQYLVIISYFAALIVSIVNLWVASCESGKMVLTSGSTFSRAAVRIGKQQSGSRSRLHFFFPGSLIVSASTVPSTLSRFHRSRLDAGVSASPLFRIERYRGGSQHDFWQQRWKGSNPNYNGRKNDREYENEHESATENYNNNNGKNNNPFSPLIQSQQRVTKVVRQGAGAMFSLVGFLGSSFVSFATDRRSFEDRFVEPIRALSNFLKTSG